MELDLNKPHATVFGMGGIQGYEQDGISYDANKKPIPMAVVEVAAPESTEDVVVGLGGDPAAAEEPAADTAESADPAALVGDSLAELNDMHWSHLKKMVEDRGGVWIDKHAAIEFLTKG